MNVPIGEAFAVYRFALQDVVKTPPVALDDRPLHKDLRAQPVNKHMLRTHTHLLYSDTLLSYTHTHTLTV